MHLGSKIILISLIPFPWLYALNGWVMDVWMVLQTEGWGFDNHKADSAFQSLGAMVRCIRTDWHLTDCHTVIKSTLVQVLIMFSYHCMQSFLSYPIFFSSVLGERWDAAGGGVRGKAPAGWLSLPSDADGDASKRNDCSQRQRQRIHGIGTRGRVVFLLAKHWVC